MATSKHIQSPSHNPIEWIVERLPDAIQRKRGGAFNYLLAAALMGVALMVRMEIAPVEAELRYVTFFPAVTLAAVIGGIWPGLFASAIGVCLATYIFTPPYYSISADTLRASLWPNIVFLMDAAIVCASIEAMHRYRARYTSERRTQDLYNHAPCGYHSLDKDGIFRQINETELAWLGYTRDEVVGKMKWPDLIAPASLHLFWESFPQFMKRGFIHDFEIELMRKDGTTLVGLVNATAIYDADGNFVMSRSSVVDISARKRAEQALRASNQKYSLLFNNSRDALMFAEGPSWKFTGANRATLELFGAANLSEFTALGPWDVSPEQQPDGRRSSEKSRKMIEAALRKGSHFFEWEHRRLDGQTFPAEVLLTAMEIGGNPAVQATVRDITVRRRAENELHWQKNFMLKIIDTDPSHIFVKDEKGVFLLVNQSMASAYGLTPAEMVGKNNADIAPLSGELFGYMSTDDQLIHDGGEIALVEPFTLKNGERHWFLTTKKRLLMPDGSFNVLGIAVDITWQRLAEIKLAESYGELQRLSAHLETVRADERARIALNLHDEMGAILAALNMRIAWLASKLPAELPQLLAETKEIKELVSGGIRTMHGVVNQLRSDLLGEAGLAAAIRDYVKKFQEHTKIACNLILPKEEFNLNSDQALTVFRILQEALNNVVKHSRADEVRIHFTEQDELLVMEVADNGVGFDPSAQKGKSIGLLGIRERALLIGGQARIISAPGDGAAVWVSIPHAHKSHELV